MVIQGGLLTYLYPIIEVICKALFHICGFSNILLVIYETQYYMLLQQKIFKLTFAVYRVRAIYHCAAMDFTNVQLTDTVNIQTQNN